MASDPELPQWEDARTAPSATQPSSWKTPALLAAGALLLLAVTFAPGSSSENADSPPTTNSPPTTVAGPVEIITVEGGDDAARDDIRQLLQTQPGVALTMCNAMTKHFSVSPEMVELGRIYAACLADFGLALRLPEEQFHPAHAIPPSLEPALVLHCGHLLTGPEMAPSAIPAFEGCVEEIAPSYGLDVAFN